MDIINKFELLKDGSIGNQPYKPLVFTGGGITTKTKNGKLYIKVSEDTLTNLDMSIEKVMDMFKNGFIEDILFNTVSRYKIKVESIDYINENSLYVLNEVIEGNTFVFDLIIE